MFLVRDSKNVKIGRAAATYAPIAQTCPDSCPLRNGNGCYAEGGNVGLHQRKRQLALTGLSGDMLALLEASEIRDSAPHVEAGTPLRLHVSGDASSDHRASLLADACAVWSGPVWTYTHAWRDVERGSWGRVSVLASCESIAAAKQALSRGYAPAVVTGPHHVSGRAYERDGVKLIPCPSQTRGVKCSDCRLCFDADALQHRGAAIAFEVHGATKKRALEVIR